jgi:hypothetical protein
VDVQEVRHATADDHAAKAKRAGTHDPKAGLKKSTRPVHLAFFIEKNADLSPRRALQVIQDILHSEIMLLDSIPFTPVLQHHEFTNTRNVIDLVIMVIAYAVLRYGWISWRSSYRQ